MTTSESPAQTTTTLAQVTATVKHHQTVASAAGARGHATLVSPGITEGRESTFAPQTDADDPLPPRTENVAGRALEILEPIMAAYARYGDSCATRDWGNCEADARADVELPDGTVLLHNVPLTFILWLEKQCTHTWRTLLEKVPTLDPRESWEFDGEKELWRSQPRQEPALLQVPDGTVLYDATPEHPAQVSEFHRPELTGVWTHVRFSGAIPPQVHSALMERLDELTIAVKLARERANATKVREQHVSAPLIAYLLHGDLPKTSQPDNGGESQ